MTQFLSKLMTIGALSLPVTALFAQSALADKSDFQIVNRTGAIIRELYISDSSLDDWGNDILGSNTLDNGSRVRVNFTDMSRNRCFYDVRAVLMDDQEISDYQLNVCTESSYTIADIGVIDSQNSAVEVQEQTPIAFEAELLGLTNRERRQAGLPPLRLSAPLGRAAQFHAEDMNSNSYLEHEGLDGSKPWDRAEREGYEGSYIGENIAVGGSSPEETIEQWMNSPGHRGNILSSEYTEIGFGYSSQNDNHYWVQVFGNR
jgi:uncharacterized protein YkwD